jgi:putative ABC transport system ATP-binding protein
MALLELQQVTKRYGSSGTGFSKTALDEFSLTVESGEFTGIMGPSGAGKTTLLNLVATIDRATSGSVVVGGTDLATLRHRSLAVFRRDNLGFVFQDHNLLETLTVRENIALPLALKRKAGERTLTNERIEERVEELAALLGITECLDKYPVENSGGQRQRAAIARALAGDPGLILADEPTGALDSKNAHLLMRSLRDLNKNHGASILLVTHDPLVASYCSRIVFIRDGRLFSEIRRAGERESFYKRIIDVLATLEGASNDA